MSPSGTYFGIDPYYAGRLGIDYNRYIAHREVAASAVGKVIWIEKTGEVAAREPSVREGPFDFLFIDADHSYEGLRGDWLSWRPNIKVNGIVALHDIRGVSCGGSVYAHREILPDPDFTIVAEVESLVVLRRGQRPPLTV
jgi:hypothetical protein